MQQEDTMQHAFVNCTVFKPIYELESTRAWYGRTGITNISIFTEEYMSGIHGCTVPLYTNLFCAHWLGKTERDN